MLSAKIISMLSIATLSLVAGGMNYSAPLGRAASCPKGDCAATCAATCGTNCGPDCCGSGNCGDCGKRGAGCNGGSCESQQKACGPMGGRGHGAMAKRGQAGGCGGGPASCLK